MTLFRDGDLPPILCGPILRRVNEVSVTVFVAVAYSADVTLSICDEAEFGSGNYRLLKTAVAPTLALGSGLHVLAITVRFADDEALSPGRNYSYDLSLTADGETVNLEDLGLLIGDFPLGYARMRLPSFALPTGLEDLRLTHGSCRKSGGDGEDILPLLDDMLKQDYASPRLRPHQLLLTGDQIYADDVPACQLATLRATAARLLGWSAGETIPYDGGEIAPDDPRLTPGPLREEFKESRGSAIGTDAKREAGRRFLTRGDFMLAQAAFTSLESDAHLMFLGEYFAQYLFAWSPELWPRNAALGPLTLATVEEATASLSSGLDADSRKAYLATAAGTRANAEAYASHLGKVRRALANIPTYTIMDDHEITDDWNIHRDWNESVQASLAGRRIVRNGLIAYAVFQDWGNQPDRYEDGPGKALLDAIRFDETAEVPPLAGNPGMLDASLGLSATSVDPSQRMRWDHVAYGPEHQILFLDTRTWRGFPVLSHGRAPAALLTPEAMGMQFDPDRLYPGRLTFVVSAGPVFGIRLVEFFQSALCVLTATGIEEADRELWSGNDAAFRDLLLRLLVLERAVFLSGDVHYSFAKRVAFTRNTDLPLKAATLVQLCCSSLRNEIVKTKALEAFVSPVGFSGRISNSDLHYSVDQRELGMRLLMVFEAAIIDANSGGASDPDYLEHLNQSYFALKRQIDLRMPVAVDDLPGPAYLQAREVLDQYQEQWVGSWKYNVTGISDSSSIRFLHPETLELDGFLTDMVTAPLRPPSPDLYVVGRNNLGLLTMRMDGGEPVSVVQTLFWRRRVFNFKRVLSLDLTADLRLPE